MECTLESKLKRIPQMVAVKVVSVLKTLLERFQVWATLKANSPFCPKTSGSWEMSIKYSLGHTFLFRDLRYSTKLIDANLISFSLFAFYRFQLCIYFFLFLLFLLDRHIKYILPRIIKIYYKCTYSVYIFAQPWI